MVASSAAAASSAHSEGALSGDEVLFGKFAELYSHLGGNLEKVEEVFVIDNPRQRRSFADYQRNIGEKHRDSEFLFRNEDWRNGNDTEDVELRKKYLIHLAEKVSKFRSQMNDGSKVLIASS